MKRQETRMIDRTLLEVVRRNPKADRLELLQLCKGLTGLGADLLEIDSQVLGKLVELPAESQFLMHIGKASELAACSEQGIRCCSLSAVLLNDRTLMETIRKQGMKAFVDLHAADEKELSELKVPGLPVHVDQIRIFGLDQAVDASWVMLVENLAKQLNVSIGICPGNRFFNATAIALEAVMAGLSHVTVSFAGYGGDHGLACTEEVLVAMETLHKPDTSKTFHALPAVSRCLSDATGIRIAEDKPVIGSGIFHYESGIHAAGIEKAAETYEPFAPELVGQSRKLHLGKHSGRKAVERKLIELGISCSEWEPEELLERIRKKSIELKRSLKDEEIRLVIGR